MISIPLPKVPSYPASNNFNKHTIVPFKTACNLLGPNYYSHHSCGHPDTNTLHHQYRHYYAVNPKGEKQIFISCRNLGNPSPPSKPHIHSNPSPPSRSQVPVRSGLKGSGGLRAISRGIAAIAIALSVMDVAEASAGNRMAVTTCEAVGFAGRVIGGAISSIIPGVGTLIGTFISSLIS
jgi:hypothetical protein